MFPKYNIKILNRCDFRRKHTSKQYNRITFWKSVLPAPAWMSAGRRKSVAWVRPQHLDNSRSKICFAGICLIFIYSSWPTCLVVPYHVLWIVPNVIINTGQADGMLYVTAAVAAIMLFPYALCVPIAAAYEWCKQRLMPGSVYDIAPEIAFRCWTKNKLDRYVKRVRARDYKEVSYRALYGVPYDRAWILTMSIVSIALITLPAFFLAIYYDLSLVDWIDWKMINRRYLFGPDISMEEVEVYFVLIHFFWLVGLYRLLFCSPARPLETGHNAKSYWFWYDRIFCRADDGCAFWDDDGVMYVPGWGRLRRGEESVLIQVIDRGRPSVEEVKTLVYHPSLRDFRSNFHRGGLY